MKIGYGNGVTILHVENKNISNVVIYEKGEVLFETKSGQIDCLVDDRTLDVTGINVTEVKNANKINLNRTDNFVVKSGTDWFGDKLYTLYLINGQDVEYRETIERKAIETDTEIYYLTYAYLTFNKGVYYNRLVKLTEEEEMMYNKRYARKELIDYNEVLIAQRYYSRTEVKEFGKQVREMQDMLANVLDIDVGRYSVEKALKEYDIIIKKKEGDLICSA